MTKSDTAENFVASAFAALVVTVLLIIGASAIGSVALLEWWNPLETRLGRGLAVGCFMWLTIVALDL